MRNHAHKKRIVILIALVLILVIPGNQIAASKLSEAEAEMADLQKQLENAKSLIDNLETSKDDIETKVRELDSQLSEISQRLSTLDGQLEEKNFEIETTQAELEAARQIEASQYENMKLRIKFMYENSTDNNYLEIFCSAGSITDMLNAVEYIKQLSQYDREMLTAYQETEAEIENYEVQLEQDKADLEELKTIAQDEKNTVSALESAKKSELSKVNGAISNAETNVDVYEDEIAAQNEAIAQIKAEMEREAAAQTPVKVYSGGVFTWPCPSSSRVTSEYGTRTSPTTGASTNHKGIDIGADFGADIVAAASGEVTFAGYSNACGNYIIINHGSGIRTVYMHASSLNVSVGEQVAAGQSIAKVGSTGISTGNHLHFGVTVDGGYVSPWNYLG